MIVLGEKADNANILHIIIGPETEDQFNFTGQSVMDISEYLTNMDKSKPCQLVINRCESEEGILQLLAYQEGQRKAKMVMDAVQRKIAGESLEQMNPVTSKTKNKNPDKKSNSGSGITCPLCLTRNSAIVEDGMVLPCKTCQEIDAGLKASEIPQTPPFEDLERLRDEIEKTDTNQKKSMGRYVDDSIDDDLDLDQDIEDEEIDGNEPESD